MVPFGGAHMNNPREFFHKGPARDYRGELTAEQIERFDRMATKKLGSDCARWLESGDESAAAAARV
jgi:aryl sulfotransferase